jgi:hypothetical protein
MYWSNYIEFHRPSGLYYKMGRDSQGDPHLLCSGDKGSLERDSVLLHDHYWRRGNKWHYQVKKGDAHLLEVNTAFDSGSVNKALDEILKKLGG